MAKGSLTIEVTNARGGALSGRLHIELDPHAQAVGGDAMEVSFNVSGHKSFEISNISCHDGPGTLYAFRLNADGFKSVRVLPAHEAGPGICRAKRGCG